MRNNNNAEKIPTFNDVMSYCLCKYWYAKITLSIHISYYTTGNNYHHRECNKRL